jgi:hypothetical protein
MRERQFPSESFENKDEKPFSEKNSRNEIDDFDDERQDQVKYYIGGLKMQLIAATIMEITRSHIQPNDKLHLRSFCDKQILS